jgi:hypothetical protein
MAEEKTDSNNNLLEQVRECGRLAMELEEVAVLAGLPLSEVFADFEAHGELYTAYRRGQVETKMALRGAVLREARSGEPGAVEEMNRYMRELDIIQYGTTEEEAGDAPAGEGGDAGEHHGGGCERGEGSPEQREGDKPVAGTAAHAEGNADGVGIDGALPSEAAVR